MAGPSSLPSAPRTTRTRRIFGTAATVGGQAVLVQTSRHAADCAAVQLIVGHPDCVGLHVFVELDPRAALWLAGLLTDAARGAA